jgi:hypothetical protein
MGERGGWIENIFNSPNPELDFMSDKSQVFNVVFVNYYSKALKK